MKSAFHTVLRREAVLGYQLSARDFYLPSLRLVRSQEPASAKLAAVTAIEALRRVTDLPSSQLKEA